MGPLVVLVHGLGDSRHSYRFLASALVAAGYRVADLDLRGCGDSSLGWDGYTRTDIAGDLVALVRHLGGPATLVGQSISGGAATIAAANEPDLFTALIELAPFTRKQSYPLGGLITMRRYRSGFNRMMRTTFLGSLPSWMKYLEPNPRAEGEKIVADLPHGLGELVVLDGAGHYPHAQTPEEVLAVALPFLAKTATHA